jgi:hypothetical protein
MRAILSRRTLSPVAVALAAGLSLTSFAMTSEAQASTTVTGKWHVTYGNAAEVKIKLTGTNAYTMKALTPIEITGGSSCTLPKGTVIATFSGTGTTLTGQHGLWNTSNCAFVDWTSLRVVVKNSNKLVEHLGNGEVHKLTRVVRP